MVVHDMAQKAEAAARADAPAAPVRSARHRLSFNHRRRDDGLDRRPDLAGIGAGELARVLERDPEKCKAVLPRDKRGTRLHGDHAQTTSQGAMTIDLNLIGVSPSAKQKRRAQARLVAISTRWTGQ
jgi:hypothetical protein